MAARPPRAFVVVDLGFGDAGKGLVTDYLVRRHAARLVVRFNGGAQAGHNVVTADGRHHTFAQLGSGSFVPGVRTHLARHVVVHPLALAVEARALVGVDDALARISIDPRCLVTTPFQQAANRLRELARDDARHGSCGVGVGETVADSLAAPELAVRFGELREPTRLRDRLLALRERKRRELGPTCERLRSDAANRELALLADPAVVDRFLDAASAIARTVAVSEDEAIGEAVHAAGDTVVFEGAQGVLLDEDFGFHPFTTWSHCTPRNAEAVLASWQHSGDVARIGVTRAYMVRHGAGPLPTEDRAVLDATRETHNKLGPWQGAVRKGWLDLALLDYALRACTQIDALAVTHLDALARLPHWCDGYANLAALPRPRSLDEQAQLAHQLTTVTPHYTDAPREPAAFITALEARLARPVALTSRGPTASDVVENASQLGSRVTNSI